MKKAALWFAVLSMACSVDHAGLFGSAVPEDIRKSNARKYGSIDEMANAFAQAGTKVRSLGNGQVIDIPYRSDEVPALAVHNALEHICLKLKGRENSASRADRLKWYLFPGHGPYLTTSGGPTVAFGTDADAAERLVKGDDPLNWFRDRGADRSSTTTMGDAVCATYGRGTIGYPNETLVRPLFVAINRCETNAKDGPCHWILLKPEFLSERVRLTRANSGTPPAVVVESRPPAAPMPAPSARSMVTVPPPRTADVIAQVNEANEAQKRGDNDTVLRIFKLLSEQGDAGAQLALGSSYLIGHLVPQSDQDAAKWLLLSAKQGIAVAQYGVGLMHLEGRGLAKDTNQANQWLLLAAEQGNAHAQEQVGLSYTAGRGVPRDYQEAARWFQLAADQGLSGAQMLLGIMHRDGSGVAKDYAEAIKWLSRSASQGNSEAQYALGGMHANGYGVPHDDKEALKWYRLAAARGNEDALAKLDQMGIKRP